jgi:hypothetical protein
LVRIAYLEFAKKSEEVVSNKEEVLRPKRKMLESSQQRIESVKIFKAQYVTSEEYLSEIRLEDEDIVPVEATQRTLQGVLS